MDSITMSDNGAKPGSIFKRAFSVILSLAILIAIDQYAKAMAVSRLKDGGPFSLLPGILELRYVENTGAAFGILQGRSGIFFVIAIVVSAVLFYGIMKLPHKRRYLPLGISMIFIIAGALGNLIDRIRLGFVVDFIYFRLIDFPVFNIADIYITCSCFMLAFLLIFYYKEGEFQAL